MRVPHYESNATYATKNYKISFYLKVGETIQTLHQFFLYTMSDGAQIQRPANGEMFNQKQKEKVSPSTLCPNLTHRHPPTHPPSPSSVFFFVLSSFRSCRKDYFEFSPDTFFFSFSLSFFLAFFLVFSLSLSDHRMFVPRTFLLPRPLPMLSAPRWDHEEWTK